MSTPDDQEIGEVVPVLRRAASGDTDGDGSPAGSTGENTSPPVQADSANHPVRTEGRAPRRRNRLIVGAVVIMLVATVVVVFSVNLGRSGPDASSPGATATTPPMPSVFTLPNVLYAQGEALVAGDLTGWLSFLDPDRPELGKQFRYMFDVLHNQGISAWKPRVTITEMSRLAGFEGLTTVDMLTTISFCIQTKDCDPGLTVGNFIDAAEGFVAKVSWVFDDGAYRISGFEVQPPSSENSFLPPWLVTNVTVAAGVRVSVAVPDALLARLPALLAAADRAAVVADKYTKVVRPDRYVVYLAGPGEWDTWYGTDDVKRDILGYAIATSRSSRAVVIKSDVVPDGNLERVLRHEFGHVVSLLGHGFGDSYLREGFAELVEEDGRPINTYYRLGDVRRLLRSGGWDGNLEHIYPYADGGFEGSAGYGLGYLTWRCIQANYGDDAMWSFARQVFLEYHPSEEPSQQAFGQPWPTVKAACASYIRAAAG